MSFPFGRKQSLATIDANIELNAFPHPKPGYEIRNTTSEQLREEISGAVSGIHDHSLPIEERPGLQEEIYGDTYIENHLYELDFNED